MVEQPPREKGAWATGRMERGDREGSEAHGLTLSRLAHPLSSGALSLDEGRH